MFRPRIIASLLLLLCISAQANNDAHPFQAHMQRLHINKALHIDVSRYELGQASGAVALEMGKSRNFSVTPLPLQLNYRVADVWELELPNALERPLVIHARVSGSNNDKGILSAHATSHVRVEARALPPRPLRIGPTHTLWRGDVMLSIDLNGASLAGAYQGSLSLNLEYEP
jgi:hypothetical protein